MLSEICINLAPGQAQHPQRAVSHLATLLEQFFAASLGKRREFAVSLFESALFQQEFPARLWYKWRFLSASSTMTDINLRSDSNGISWTTV